MQGRRILLLSGAVAAGKSTIAGALLNEDGYVSIRSGAYLRGLAASSGIDASRLNLQELGDRKDAETDYAWLIDEVAAPLIQERAVHSRWLLDCVRKARQVELFRRRFPGQILHAHLTAPEDELRRRYDERVARGGEYMGATPYEIAVAHPNEQQARSLGSIADIVLDTTDASALDQLRLVVSARYAD